MQLPHALGIVYPSEIVLFFERNKWGWGSYWLIYIKIEKQKLKKERRKGKQSKKEEKQNYIQWIQP
jgi:hypothetical protein